MILVDFSSILYRISNGSLNSIRHVKTTHPHKKNKNDILYDNSYRQLGVVSYIFNEYEFVFELEPEFRYDKKKFNISNCDNVEYCDKVIKGQKYPLEAYKSVFSTTLFHNLKDIKNKFSTSGNMVLCLDHPTSKGYWRKDIDYRYKGKRKKARSESNIDFGTLYEYINNEFFPTIEKHFPITILKYDRAEGDDVIAILTKNYSHNEIVTIITEDKDTAQLHRHPNVVIYRPMLNRFIDKLDKTEVEDYILKHTLLGDAADNILVFSLKTRYHPDFLKWFKNHNAHTIFSKTFGKDLNEYDVPQFEFILESEQIYLEFIQYKHIKYFEKYYVNDIDKLSLEEIKLLNPSEFTNYFDIEEILLKEVPNKVFKHYWHSEKSLIPFMENFDTNIKENPLWEKRWHLNRTLVDFKYIPQDIQEGIVKEYENLLSQNSTFCPDVAKNYLKQNHIKNPQLIIETFFNNFEENTAWASDWL